MEYMAIIKIIIDKYGLPKDSSLKDVAQALELKKMEYEYEIMNCLRKKSVGYVTVNGGDIISSVTNISDMVNLERRNAEQAGVVADQMLHWQELVSDIEQDLQDIGSGKNHSLSHKKISNDYNILHQTTRDCTEAAALLEGCDLMIHDSNKIHQYEVMRPVYTQHEFDMNHGGTVNKSAWGKKLLVTIKANTSKHCSELGLKVFLLRCLPFIQIMSKYKWREWILADIIAGIIVGVMHIPQSMAYAMLANLDPMYGLYVSFFPAIIYFFLGTSRHNSMGTIAVVSLLSGKFLDKSLLMFPLNSTDVSGNHTTLAVLGQMKASRAAGLTLCVGLVQVLMNIFQLGFLTRYLSDPLISGFTVGAAIHVFTSQVKSCFGIKIPKQYGVFNIPLTYYQIFKNISKTNIPTIVMTLISVVILVVTKEFINPRVVKKIRVPIPMELIMVICGTLASSYLDLNKNHNMKIVGKIYQGLPPPTMPNLTNMSHFISDIFITAIIAFSICVSLAKIFGKKHNYTINPNQECLAYGAMNIFSSFFLCYTSAASLSRSAVQESIGGKTQLTSLIASALVLIVVLFIGPLFYALPQCILASIIVVALKGMFMHFGELKELWIFSYWDFTIWLVSFLATTLLDIDYGLMIGVALSIVSIMLRTQSPKSHMLGQIDGTDIYKNIVSYKECKEIEGVKIFRFEGSLYYACSDYFRKSLYRKVMCNPRKVLEKIHKLEQKLVHIDNLIEKLSEEDASGLRNKRKGLEDLIGLETNIKLHHVIIDCSTWGYIDFVGVKTLHQVIEEYRSIKVTVFLANPKTDIRDMFARSKCYKVIDDKIIYVSVHDAVINSLFEYKINSEAKIAEEVSSL